MYGELNTNGKVFVADVICEALPVIVGTVKTLDSATICLDRDDFQTACDDAGCPRCNGNTLSIATLRGPTAGAVIMQDLLGRLPHATLDDGVTPANYRMNYFGNFPFTTLNRRDFRERRGEL